MRKSEKLEELKKRMQNDKDLPLRNGATQLVFGVGDPDSEMLFIGEAPGYWEDQKGEPFVGNAGALLNRLLASIGIERRDVYITNVIHFRPPENRDPEPGELSAYRPYLDEIIDIIQPSLIVTLGRFSMAKFIPGVFISSVHGKSKVVDWKGRKIVVLPMYHPAAALRSGDVKFKLANDFKAIPDIISNLDKILNRESDNINDKVTNENKSEQMELI